jgi:hypothetical protein
MSLHGRDSSPGRRSPTNLKTSVRTVQRWEKDELLPVHRHAHARQDTVYLARTTRRRKHIAWARKLLGDVAAMEDRPREAVAHYEAGLSTLQRYPCPSVQWKISAALAAAHATLHQSKEAEQWRAATQRVLRDLAASIREGPLQTRFRQSKVVREFRAG